mmetsp:Transcript_26238/g.55672  ORF Transcript_26238/g.55672 Transcript_26238/m.55672 type:complete len:244 (-) Transcript_26238:2-733(-)
MAGVGCVEDGHRLRRIAQALAQLATGALGRLLCRQGLLRDQCQEILTREEALDLLAQVLALGNESGLTIDILAPRVIPEGRPTLVALHRLWGGQEHHGGALLIGGSLLECDSRLAFLALLEDCGRHVDAAVLHGAQYLDLGHRALASGDDQAEVGATMLQGLVHALQRLLVAGHHSPAFAGCPLSSAGCQRFVKRGVDLRVLAQNRPQTFCGRLHCVLRCHGCAPWSCLPKSDLEKVLEPGRT